MKKCTYNCNYGDYFIAIVLLETSKVIYGKLVSLNIFIWYLIQFNVCWVMCMFYIEFVFNLSYKNLKTLSYLHIVLLWRLSLLLHNFNVQRRCTIIGLITFFWVSNYNRILSAHDISRYFTHFYMDYYFSNFCVISIYFWYTKCINGFSTWAIN